MAILELIKSPLEQTDRAIHRLQRALDISKVTSRVLVNRGIYDEEHAKIFLNPNLEQLFDPFELCDMDKAVHRINEAADKREHITIFGDYDVDGITSSAILYDLLTDLGCKVDVYIPNRHREGYGVNLEAIGAICNKGSTLMITVDCGITSVDEVEFAGNKGMDVIITDHHQCGPILPEAIAIINPSRNPNLHEKHPLAGVGVVGKLVQAIGGQSYLKRYLDLIALGTVADVVPVIGDNRVFVAEGLIKMNRDPCIGIEALMSISGLGDKDINTGRIAFGLAPRLNAAGRIDDPLAGYRLLSAKRLSDAIPIARLLEEQNRQRQAMEAQIIQDAQEMMETQVDLGSDKIIVLGKEGWNSGVIGIAASKIVEKYCRPCILIAIKDGLGVGSARGIGGFSIYDAIDSCSHLLKKFGGHHQAAGISLAEGKIPDLRSGLLEYCDKAIRDDMLIPRHKYDAELGPEDISYSLIDELQALQPFGIGNPSPTFLVPEAYLAEYARVGGQGNHLKVSVDLGKRLWDGIAFGMGERSEFLSTVNKVSIVTGLDRNEWRGVSKIQFNIKHMDMVLECRNDWTNFLAFFHLKFFDAFFRDFMYNKHCNYAIFPQQPGMASRKTIEEVFSELKQNRMGNLILINSLWISQELIGLILDSPLLDRIEYSYGQSYNWDGIGVNRLVFAPIYSELDFSGYRNVYLFEGEISCCLIDPNDINSEIYTIAGELGRADQDSRLREEYLVEHRDFALFYRWIRSLSPGRNIWRDWLELVNSYRELDPCI
ncbi:MAG TPA: single-stranded-DNA-specific exonuclease RecJ, partial [Clostridia bacterium]|nr:single-stranded-DNA-specific exonuclease RecJ [Clostridia bacterium]